MQLHFSKVEDIVSGNMERFNVHGIKHWVLFGEDRGGVMLLKQKIKLLYVEKLKFNHVYYRYNNVKNEIKQLLYHLRSRTLFGSNTLVIVDEYPDSYTNEWKEILNDTNLLGSMLIIADQLKQSGKVRKSTENMPYIATVNCYQKNTKEIKDCITKFFNIEGIKYTSDVIDIMLRLLPPDSMIIQNELEKLKNFCDTVSSNKKNYIINTSAITQLLYDTSELELDALCSAYVSCNVEEVVRCLKQIENNEVNFMLILRVLQNYLIRIIDIKIKYNELKDKSHQSVIMLINTAKPQFFGKSRDNVIKILHTIDLRYMRRLLFFITKLEVKCKNGIVKEPQFLLLYSILYSISERQ